MPKGKCVNKNFQNKGKICPRFGKPQTIFPPKELICSTCKKPLVEYQPPKIESTAQQKRKLKGVKSKVGDPTVQKDFQLILKKRQSDIAQRKADGEYMASFADQFPKLQDLELTEEVLSSRILMAPMGCCGFLLKPQGITATNKVKYLGTTGLGPCVAFCLYDIGTGVSLVSHFESTSLDRDCVAIASALASVFLEEIFRNIDPVSYFRCWIIHGIGPDPKTSSQIQKNLEQVYLEAAASPKVENSELVPVSHSTAGTVLLDTWVGKLYNVAGLDEHILNSSGQVKEFNKWTKSNKGCGAIYDLELPLSETKHYGLKAYQT